MCEKSEEEDERCRFFCFVSPNVRKGKVPAREKRETREVEATDQLETFNFYLYSTSYSYLA